MLSNGTNPMLRELGGQHASPKTRFIREFMSLSDKSVICGESTTTSSSPKIFLNNNSGGDNKNENNDSEITFTQLKELLEDAPCGKNDSTVLDTEVRKTQRVADLSKIRVEWNEGLQSAIEKIEAELLSPPNMLVTKKIVKAEVHSVLFYQHGDFFKLHRDSKKHPNHELTLTVNASVKGLNNEKVKAHGGGIRFPHADVDYQSDNEEDNDADDVVILDPISFDEKDNNAVGARNVRFNKTKGLLPCGVWNDHAPGSWAAWFSSELHQVEKIMNAGAQRIAITFNLMTEEATMLLKDEGAESSNSATTTMKAEMRLASRLILQQIAASRKNNFIPNTHKQTKIGVLLCHQYSSSTDGNGDDEQQLVPRSSIRGRDAKIVRALENNQIFRFEVGHSASGYIKTEKNFNGSTNKRRVKLIPVHVIVEKPRYDHARVSTTLQSLMLGSYCAETRKFLPPPQNDLVEQVKARLIHNSPAHPTMKYCQLSRSRADYSEAWLKLALSEKELSEVMNIRGGYFNQDNMTKIRELWKKGFENDMEQLRKNACQQFSEQYQKTRSGEELDNLLFDAGQVVIASDLKDLRKVSSSKKKRSNNDITIEGEFRETPGFLFPGAAAAEAGTIASVEVKEEKNDQDDFAGSPLLSVEANSHQDSSSSSSDDTDEGQQPATKEQKDKLVERQQQQLETNFSFSNDDTALIAAKPLRNIAVANGLAVFVRASGLIDVIDTNEYDKESGTSDKILWGNDEMFNQYWLKTTMAVLDIDDEEEQGSVSDATSVKIEKESGKRRGRD